MKDRLRKGRLSRGPDRHDILAAALVEAGMVEAAVADAALPARDEPLPCLRGWRALTDTLGVAVAASWDDLPAEADRWLDVAIARLEGLAASRLPGCLALRTPEGFAFYAVYPEAYLDAAREWASRRRPERVVCLGLRGIGTSLASAVHGGLAIAGFQTATWTLRPRGHPFDRHIDAAPELLDGWSPEDATFLIIDEGPGLSGSSLAGAAAWLSASGVPDDRIVLLCAWNPPVAALRSEQARRRWPRHEIITASFESVRGPMLSPGRGNASAIDVSCGRWREAFLSGGAPDSGGGAVQAARWPAVHPQHERVKILVPGERLVKFAGLARFGEAALARAERLSGRGFTTRPLGLARGFLSLALARGAPVTRAAVDGRFLSQAASYIASLRRDEATTATASPAPLAAMLEVNSRAALGERAGRAAARLIRTAASFEEPAVRVDGRMQLHEWISTAGGFVKTDALDHHCDHFLPGITDAAWDVAGLVIEAGLDRAAERALVERYRMASRDVTIERRLPFHLAAYCAFRLGYATLAASSAPAEEAVRFATLRDRYASVLRMRLRRAAASAPSAA